MTPGPGGIFADLDTIRRCLALGLPLTADEGRALVDEIDLLREAYAAAMKYVPDPSVTTA